MVVRVGTVGNDKLRGTKHNDNLSGGGGDDILYGGKGYDLLDGGIGNDTLFGERGNDTLLGNTGDDALYGGGGEDSIDGGDGNDTIIAGSGNDSVDGGIGDDMLHGNAGSDTLNGGDGNDTLDGGRNGDILNGGNGDDTYSFAMTNRFGFGNDVVTDTVGSDVLDFSTLSASVTVHLDTSTASSRVGSVDFTGATSITSILGGLGNDAFIVAEGFGNITLDGGGGDNTIDGSLVTSALTVDVHGGTYADGAHTVTFTAMNNFIGGTGNDTFTVTDISAPVTLDGGAGNDFVDMSSLGGADNATVSFGVTGLVNAISVSNVESVTTGAGDDTFSFAEGFGTVTIDGGTGTNTLDLSDLTTSNATVDFTAGTATNTGSGGTITFTNTENATGGAGNDTFIFGNAFGTHTVDGRAGTNTVDLSAVTTNLVVDFSTESITTGGGALTIANIQDVSGGTGADTYTVEASVASTVSIADAGGNDTYQGFASGGFGAVTLSDSGGTDAIDLTGFAQADVTAWQSVDLFGGDGLPDSLVVNLATGDKITVQHYFNNDITVAGTGQIESFNFSDGSLGFGGITYTSSVSAPTPIPSPSPAPSPAPSPYTGTSGNDVITGGVGSDSLTGLGGNDTLNGAAGNDTLNGGSGNDIYRFTTGSFGNDTVIDTAGMDVLNFSAITDNISVDLHASLITSLSGNVDYSGGTSVQNIIAGSGNDVFAFQNGFGGMTLAGGTGDNSMDASAVTHLLTVDMDAGTVSDGTHTITFTDMNYFLTGSGNDTFIVSDLTHSVTLDGGTGNDALNMSALTGTENATVSFGVFGFGGVTYVSNIESVTTGAGNDIFVFADSYENATVNGGTGTNSLDLSNMSDAVTVNFTAHTATDDTTGTGVIAFSQIADVTTGISDDTFVLGNAFGTHALDAGIGTNHLDLSSVSTNLVVDFNAGTVTTTGGALTIANFQDVIGGAGNDTYTLGSANPVATITDAGGSNTYQGFGSGGFGNLVISDTGGGSQVDLTGFAQADVTAWSALDLFGGDALPDSLQVQLASGDTITVQHYFANDVTVAGTGVIGTFHFNDGDLAFNNVSLLV
jgi:Ca2+-binding RTX toxin-like protein